MKKLSLTSLCLCCAVLGIYGCASSEDADSCPTGETFCEDVGMCINVNTNPDHCGACGNKCSSGSNVASAYCAEAVCKITCDPGYSNCDGNPANGCEIAGECGGGNNGGGNNGGGNNGGGNNGGGNNGGGNNGGGNNQNSCQMTFKYVNADTCAATGGAQDWPVYLIGSMNDWATADAKLQMNAGNNCERTVTFDVKAGETYQYKFYVDGWGDDSYRADSSKLNAESNNEVTASCGGTVEFVEKAANGGGNNSDPNACKMTFKYTNVDTCAATGGTQDWPVYLIGSMNGWTEADAAMEMKADGSCVRSVTIDVNADETYQYKFFVSGWGDDSYRADNSNLNEENNNYVTAECGKAVEFNEKAQSDTPQPQDCTATFNYSNEWLDKNGDGSAAQWDVYLVGSFNADADGNWILKDPAYKMTGDGNGNRTITINVSQNTCYDYKYYVDGWDSDAWKSDNGNDNGHANITSCGRTFGNGTTDASCGGDNGGGSSNPPVVTSSNCYLASQPTVNGKQVSFTLACNDGTTAISSVSGGSGSESIDGMTVKDTVPENSKYGYIVKAGNNEVYVPVWVEDKAFNWHDAVLYFAFTDRFKDGDSGNNEPKTNATVDGSSNAQWMGGDFKGMREKVEEGYFDALGVNALWISSVSMNAQGTSQGTNGDEAHWYSAYHSYWPVSSFMTDSNMSEFTSQNSQGVQIQAIEPHFGTMEELKALVDACHKRGIRVLVDFAANQVHIDSPVYKNHRDWFNDADNPVLCDTNNCNGSCWNNYSEKCWFSQDLPDINYDNADARNAMMEHVKWLLKTTNIDGFRVDAVKHMALQFIKDLRATTDGMYANSGHMFYMVGETFTGDVKLLNKFIGDDLLHAQFDFPMYYALNSHVLGLGNYAEVANLSNQFNSDLMGTFMGNHDVARALSVAAGQNQNKWGQNSELTSWEPYLKVKTALTILMTNPGVPMIYYGDEYGMEGANDPDNRRMMEFGDSLNSEQKGMLSYVQQLGQIRKNHPAITRGHRENLSAGGGYWCYKVSDGSETIIVGVARADGGDNSGCDLKGSYKLQNLLDTTASEFTTSSLDLNGNRLQVYLVK